MVDLCKVQQRGGCTPTHCAALTHFVMASCTQPQRVRDLLQTEFDGGTMIPSGCNSDESLCHSLI
jgi:hypothetical protein